MRIPLCLLAASLLAPLTLAAPAAAAAPPERSCAVPAAMLAPIGAPATGRALRAGTPVRIVAFGSSSTEGVGASSPAASYPAQLQAMLSAQFPGTPVEVVNKGIGGEDLIEMAARLDRDVLGLAPTLVLWQVGTNDILRGRDPLPFGVLLAQSIARLQAAGIEVLLIDPQTFPREAELAAFTGIVAQLRAAAKTAGAGVVPRHDAMRHWLDGGQFTYATMLSPDGLHMTDASYRCLASLVAQILTAPPPTAGAGDGATRS